MSTYDDEEVVTSGVRRRAIGTAAGLIVIVGAAAFVGNAAREDRAAPETTTTVAVEATAPVEQTTTVPPTTLPPQPLPCPPSEGATKTQSFPMAPPMCIDMAAKYRAKVRTDKGTVWITLDQNAAPQTVNNFVYLAGYGFYDGLPFHRVIGDFLIQSGSPTPDGEGGPGYVIPAEIGTEPLEPGSVVMADRGNGSQFFIVSGASGAALDPAEFNPIGKVTQGLDVVKDIDSFAVEGSEVSSTLITIKSLEIVKEGGADPAATTTAPAA
jgi:cyclophilin family peptidyl-prolyl cis-trans isomerase